MLRCMTLLRNAPPLTRSMGAALSLIFSESTLGTVVVPAPVCAQVYCPYTIGSDLEDGGRNIPIPHFLSGLAWSLSDRIIRR
jgi:hypothetical protein